VDFPAAMPYTDIMERFDRACVDEVVAFTDLVGGTFESPRGAQEALQAFADEFRLYSYRYPVAPDRQIQASQIDMDAAVPRALTTSTQDGSASTPWSRGRASNGEVLGGPLCSAARLLERVLTVCQLLPGDGALSRRERSTAMPTGHEVNSARVKRGHPIMGSWPLSTWPPNWCMEVRHE
jgi:hypothetical protein